MIQEVAAKAVSDALAQQATTHNAKIANLQRNITNLQNSNDNSSGSGNAGGASNTQIVDKSFLPGDWADAVALDSMITTRKVHGQSHWTIKSSSYSVQN